MKAPNLNKDMTKRICIYTGLLLQLLRQMCIRRLPNLQELNKCHSETCIIMKGRLCNNHKGSKLHRVIQPHRVGTAAMAVMVEAEMEDTDSKKIGDI